MSSPFLSSCIAQLANLRRGHFGGTQGRPLLFRLFLTCLLALGLWGLPTPWAQAVDYNRESLVGADFANQVLTDVSFTKANMRESNLSHSDLRGVSFFATNLEAANLEGADLRNATLDAARLSQANLSNAILEGAFAFNAKFDGTIIDGADFTDVEVRDDVRAALCARATGVNPVTQRETRATLNCQ
jgi:uncharacterized protein YjbI with pentapeptide repeats